MEVKVPEPGDIWVQVSGPVCGVNGVQRHLSTGLRSWVSGSLQFWFQLSRLANKAHNWGCRFECGRTKGSQNEVCWQLNCSGLKMLHTLALKWGVCTLAPSWIQGLDSDVSPIGNFVELRLAGWLRGYHSAHLSLRPPPAKRPFSAYIGGWGGGRVCSSCCLSPRSVVPSRIPLSN